MPFPPKVKPGDPIKAADWNTLLDCLRSMQILPSAGVRVTRSPSGTLLAVVPVPPKRGGASVERHFFELIKVSDGVGNDKVFRVVGSTIDGVVPTFDGATADGEDWLVTVSASGKIWGCVTINESNGSKSATELKIGSTAPATYVSGGEYNELIGYYAVDGDTLTVGNYLYGPMPADIFRDWWQNPIKWVLEWLT